MATPPKMNINGRLANARLSDTSQEALNQVVSSLHNNLKDPEEVSQKDIADAKSQLQGSVKDDYVRHEKDKGNRAITDPDGVAGAVTNTVMEDAQGVVIRHAQKHGITPAQGSWAHAANKSGGSGGVGR